MKEIFEKSDENWVTPDRYKLNLNIPRENQVTFGTKSLTFYGPKMQEHSTSQYQNCRKP